MEEDQEMERGCEKESKVDEEDEGDEKAGRSEGSALVLVHHRVASSTFQLDAVDAVPEVNAAVGA